MSSSRRWILIFLKTRLSCQSYFRIPYSAAGTWHIQGIAFFCMFPSRNRLYALPLRWKTRILNRSMNILFLPNISSFLHAPCFLAAYDWIFTDSWLRESHASHERLGFRSNRRPYKNSFILRPSPFRLPLSTIPQSFLPITKLPCRNSNSRMLA